MILEFVGEFIFSAFSVRQFVVENAALTVLTTCCVARLRRYGKRAEGPKGNSTGQTECSPVY